MIALRFVLAAMLLAGSVSAAFGQAVEVKLSLDKTSIQAGESTLLHVSAQILPALRSQSDRIFSWYLDLLNSNTGAAQLDSAKLAKPASDNDPELALNGTLSDGNLTGIFDTFMGLDGAGRDTPVELFAIPIKGLAPGKTTLKIRHGSGVAPLAYDFIAAPAGGGEPYTGGDYGSAQIDLTVELTFAAPALRLSVTKNPQTQQLEARLEYDVQEGADYFVQTADGLKSPMQWDAIPGGPQNSGLFVQTIASGPRFFRVHAEPKP
jgi:hypothetical protein